jgi:TonB family protein
VSVPVAVTPPPTATPPAGLPITPPGATPPATPPPRKTIATPAVGTPSISSPEISASAIELSDEITDVLPVPTPEPFPAVQLTPPPPPPRVAAPPLPPPPAPEVNPWDVGAVPQALSPRSARADKTMMVVTRGISKRVIALLLFAAACAVGAAVIVVMHSKKSAQPIDAGIAMAKPIDAPLAVVAPEPDAAEPEIDVPPDAGVAHVVTPPTHPTPHLVEPTPHPTPHPVEPTPHPLPHQGSAAVVAPIEPAKPVTGPPPEPGCDEVSCVLDRYARPCCAKFKPADGGFDPHAGLPDHLDKAMVKSGIEPMKPRVIACGEKNAAKGTVKISLTVAPNGSVTDASVADSPDPALGACVAAALRHASFAKTVNGSTFVYPFAF